MCSEDVEARWRELSDEVITGMAEWRMPPRARSSMARSGRKASSP
jgi:hypothetical protein